MLGAAVSVFSWSGQASTDGIDAGCRDKLEAYRAYNSERLSAFDREQATVAAAVAAYDARIERLKQSVRDLDAAIDDMVRAGEAPPGDLWDRRSALQLEIAAVGRETLPLYDRQEAIARESLEVQLSPWSKAVLAADLGLPVECPQE
jgi:hypothetical protein